MAHNKVCKCCNQSFITIRKHQKFCSQSCASRYNNTLVRYYQDNPSKKNIKERNSQKGRHKQPITVFDLSKRTISKILRRLNIACSRCGWNEEICDIHHIVSKKNGGTDNHDNLSCLCPNCHRLASRGKITEFTTLWEQIGDKWKEYYFG